MLRPTVWMLLAVLLLVACDNGERQRLQLAELERQNRADSLMLNDSLARDLAYWFDRHGTRNEQMRAHYILGRTYADRGESPAALDAYNDAADRADTTAQDCDYKTLSRVHAQKAELFYYQLLADNMIREERQAMRYAKLAKDTMIYIACYAMMAEGYEMKGELDSALVLLNETYEMFRKIGNTSYAASLCCSMANIYVQEKDYVKAKKFIREYEQASGLFHDDGDVDSGKEMCYYVKGNIYLYTNQEDSAEYFFRKLLKIADTYDQKIAALDGLQIYYQEIFDKDSLIKYSMLSDSLSSIAHNEIEMDKILKVQSLYDYSRNEKLAYKKTLEADRFRNLLFVTASIAVILLLLAIIVFRYYQTKRKLAEDRYQNEMEKLAQAQTDLLALRSEYHISEKLLEKKDAEVKGLQQKVNDYRKEVHHLQGYAVNERLQKSAITHRLRHYLDESPYKSPDFDDWKQLKMVINQEIPTFYETLNGDGHSLNDFEYDICMLIRIQMSPSDIAKLKGCAPSYVTYVRRNVYKKLFNKEGLAEHLDEYIMSLT